MSTFCICFRTPSYLKKCYCNYVHIFMKVQGIVAEMQTRYADIIGMVPPRTHLMGGEGNRLQMVLDVNEFMALNEI